MEEAAKHTPGPWHPLTVKAGKGRAIARHWIKGPNGERAGHYPSAEAAQAECDRLNAAIAKATGEQQ
jgi:hypothetical protein